ncbi:hypothetical protein [Wolbachia endosymbiont of Cardiocondyla obscurior]|nr:hypothetical protein [Wolbachia endosymbiont of Cardiocondyla obscurior]RLT59739.1 hypothetical protein WANA13_0634 [Wolbachia endosymbiont of Drosophila ananassae]RLT62971.1 hypothetical protein WANA34_0646 [Wolbachia endosymbiont of Drosophila ananassae]
MTSLSSRRREPSYRDSFAVSLDPANKQRDDELLNHHYTVIPRFIRGIS